ncbi:unnamed protein product [Paramecium pentaurelia]|uniref:Uncharacterized protein n=1 Tax=Paramecium pentaurelia TaxID=43138 RepID=A0A8S1YIY3_9CILI|nr:unnamed protein product [Paramecium pentaurelia]
MLLQKLIKLTNGTLCDGDYLGSKIISKDFYKKEGQYKILWLFYF